MPYLVIVTRRPGNAQEERPRVERSLDESAIWKPAALILPAVALIVVGSFGMVRSALVLAGDWHVPKVIVGIIVLAVLTSLPNAFTAVRLGLSHRGVALVKLDTRKQHDQPGRRAARPRAVRRPRGALGQVDFDLAWLLTG